MFLTIDRVSKFTYVEFPDRAARRKDRPFLITWWRSSHKRSTSCTDNGMAFADLPKNRDPPTMRLLGPHILSRLHRPWHRAQAHQALRAWTNGQAERMNRTIKDATVKVYHYDDLESLQANVLAFVAAYNFAKHLIKALRW